MLVERYNEKTKEFECFDSDLEWIAFTGYGATREIARYAYFSKSCNMIKSQGIVNIGLVT